MTPAASPPNSSDENPLTTLSPAEAEAILAQDLRNILLKVKELKPLTDREREIIRQRTVALEDRTADVCGQGAPQDGFVQDPKWAKPWVDLAAILGVDRRTIGNWRQQPGCPSARPNGQFLVSEWREFARRIGNTSAAATAGGTGAPDDKRELEARKLRAECEEREHKLATRRGEFTANSVIGEQLAALVQEAISVLRAKFERELPPEYTGDVVHDTALNKAAIDEVCHRLSDPLPCQDGAAQPQGGDRDDE